MSEMKGFGREILKASEPEDVVPAAESTDQSAIRERERAMEELGGQPYRDVSAFCARRLKDRGSRNPEADAREVMQQVMIVAWRKIGQMKSVDNVTAWLLKVAKDVMADMYKHDHRMKRMPEGGIGELDAHKRKDGSGSTLGESIPEEDRSSAMQARIDMEKLLASLDQDQAEAVRLTYLEGLSVEEAAEEMAVTPIEAEELLRTGYAELQKKALGGGGQVN